MSLHEYEGTVPQHVSRTNTGPQLPAVMLGRVARRYAPTDPASQSHKFVEYDLVVDVGSELRATSRIMLRHCVVASAFGGVADYSTHTLRVDAGAADVGADWADGSRVLVLAVNGSAFGGVIVGGIQHPLREADNPGDNEAVWRFNGVTVAVRDDGSFSLTYGGAQNVDGTEAADVDTPVTGSTLKFAADGSVTMGTAELNEFVRMDRGSGKTEVVAQTTVSVQSGEVVEIQPTSPGTFKVGLGTDAMVKGTTYRAAEAAANAAVAAGTTAAAAAWTALSTMMADPGWIAMIALAQATAGPSSAIAVSAGAAAIAAVSAASAEGAAAAGVTALEAGAPGYLSPRSSTD